MSLCQLKKTDGQTERHRDRHQTEKPNTIRLDPDEAKSFAPGADCIPERNLFKR